MKWKYDLKYYNFFLLFLVAGMNVCGILIVRSASGLDASVVTRQIIGSLVSFFACFVFSLIDYRRLLKAAGMVYGFCVFALAAVLIWGAVRKGAGRWIVLPVVGQIQPAEFVKIGLILYFASFFEKHAETVSSVRTVLQAVILFALPAVLILLEPNLSTTIIMSVIFAFLVFCSGISLRWVLGTLAAAAASVAAVLFTFTTDLYKGLPFLRDYQKNRILGFLYPEQYAGISTQQTQSIIAIGSGGLLGKGLYNTDISSVKAGNFLIEEDTDFIFAIVGEELGFRGAILLLAGYALILFLILSMASRAKDLGGRLICVGVAVWIGFQTFTNIAVATGLFPNTGVTLPLISRGVSSLLSIYIGIGISLNVGLQRKTT